MSDFSLTTSMRARADTVTESVSSSERSPFKVVADIKLLVPPLDHKIGVVIAKDATVDSFIFFVKENTDDSTKNEIRRKFFLLSNGNIIMKEVPASPVHNKTVDLIKGFVNVFNFRHTGEMMLPFTASGDYPTEIDRNNTGAQPDVIIARTGTNRPPSVVVEVICSNGGVEAVRDYAEHYFTPTSRVQMFIAIKIMYPGNRLAPGQFKACVFVFRRDHGLIPVDIISFGNIAINPRCRQHIQTVMGTDVLRGEHPQPRCTSDQDYIINIPWEVFVMGNDDLEIVPWLEAEISHQLQISMFRLQRIIALSFPEMDIPYPQTHENPDQLWDTL